MRLDRGHCDSVDVHRSCQFPFLPASQSLFHPSLSFHSAFYVLALKMEGENSRQKQLRAAILAIKGDESLDAETKAKKIRVRAARDPFLFSSTCISVCLPKCRPLPPF